MRKRVRELALTSHTRLIAGAAVWLSLFLYAGRPLLVGAAAAGLAPSLAWSALVILAAAPALPMVLRRGHGFAYAVLGVFSTLLVLVLLGDLIRLGYHLFELTFDSRLAGLTILGGAGALSLVG